MTTDEKNALLGYLEFELIAMADSLAAKYAGKLDSSDIGDVYDHAYEVLNEVERTLADTEVMASPQG